MCREWKEVSIFREIFAHLNHFSSVSCEYDTKACSRSLHFMKPCNTKPASERRKICSQPESKDILAQISCVWERESWYCRIFLGEIMKVLFFSFCWLSSCAILYFLESVPTTFCENLPLSNIIFFLGILPIHSYSKILKASHAKHIQSPSFLLVTQKKR